MAAVSPFLANEEREGQLDASQPIEVNGKEIKPTHLIFPSTNFLASLLNTSFCSSLATLLAP